MKYYKLTDENGRTHNSTQWGEGVTHTATVKGKTLCTDEVIHVYASPLLASLLNPIHANFYRPRLWECECSRPVANDGTKLGVKSCTTLREIPLPVVTTEQRVRFAILCALKVYHAKEYVLWADGWLTGKDRARKAVYAAAHAADAVYAAARAAADAAHTAARAAAHAAAHTAAHTLNLSKLAEEAVR